MQQAKQLTAEEYEVLKAMEQHLTTARVGYVRGFTNELQKQLKKVHNAHFETYRKSGPILCSQCVMQMLRDLTPLFDAYKPEVPKPQKKAAAPKKTTKKKK